MVKRKKENDVCKVYMSTASTAPVNTINEFGKRPMSVKQLEEDDNKKRVMHDSEMNTSFMTTRPVQLSLKEDEVKTFTDALNGKCGGVDGILRPFTRKSNGSVRENKPYAHQLKCARRALPPAQNRMLICHDPGTGKTFTFLLIVAAMHTVMKGVRRKTLISAPAGVLEQWKTACLDTLRIPEKNILMTNKLSKITSQSLAKHDIIIVSRNLIGQAFSKCHEWKTRHHQNERGNWLSQWDAKKGVQIHCLFRVEFDLLGIDEVHFCRNPLTAWTKGHELVASKSAKVEGLTATPVFNKPQDLIGIGTAIDLPPRWKETSTWFKDRQKTEVNLQTVQEFQGFTDRVTDGILNLPPLVDHFINFDAAIDPMHVEDYNETLAFARRIRFSLERSGRATQHELQKLMSALQKLQQFLISPLLAELGASAVQKDHDIAQQASLDNTGALRALKKTIIDLQGEGFSRVMVACCHTSLLAVADCYLKRECPGIGNIVQYHGGLNLKKRGEAISTFLNDPQTILLMSIDAGGTGLHLVPGANAVVFWGSRPFSPMQVIQTKKRVHRIGQEFPVKVVHLIAKGSVDYAINFVHKDKLSLAKAVMDQETTNLEAEGGKWRTTGRIVDSCKFLSDDGNFPDEDITENDILERLNHGSSSNVTDDEYENVIVSGEEGEL
jgi:SNF2 family DNA or RNA helicase